RSREGAGRIGQAGRKEGGQPRAGLGESDAGDAPSTDREVRGTAHATEVLLAAADRQVIDERAHEAVAAGEKGGAPVGFDVEVVVHVVAVVSLAAGRDRGGRRGAQRIGQVVGERVVVGEHEVARKAAIEFQGERVVLIARAVVTREHLAEVRELQVLLAQCRSGHESRVAYRVRSNLVQVRAIDQVVRVRAGVAGARYRSPAKTAIHGDVPLDDARVFQVILVRAAIAGVRGGAARAGRKCVREFGAAVVSIVAGVDAQQRVQYRAQHRHRVHAEGSTNRRLVVVAGTPRET